MFCCKKEISTSEQKLLLLFIAYNYNTSFIVLLESNGNLYWWLQSEFATFNLTSIWEVRSQEKWHELQFYYTENLLTGDLTRSMMTWFLLIWDFT